MIDLLLLGQLKIHEANLNIVYLLRIDSSKASATLYNAEDM